MKSSRASFVVRGDRYSLEMDSFFTAPPPPPKKTKTTPEEILEEKIVDGPTGLPDPPDHYKEDYDWDTLCEGDRETARIQYARDVA